MSGDVSEIGISVGRFVDRLPEGVHLLVVTKTKDRKGDVIDVRMMGVNIEQSIAFRKNGIQGGPRENDQTGESKSDSQK